MEYVQRLIELRREKNISQTELAEILQTTQQQISKYEKYTQELPIHHLITLAQFYNISTDYILGLTDEKRTLTTPPKKIKHNFNIMSIKAVGHPTNILKLKREVIATSLKSNKITSNMEEEKKKK